MKQLSFVVAALVAAAPAFAAPTTLRASHQFPGGRGDVRDEMVQIIAREAKAASVDLDHPVAGKLPTVASPMRFSETKVEYRGAPPTLGQHTDEVLRSLLEKSDTELGRLRAAKVI